MSRDTVAARVGDYQLASYQRAVRLLLTHPVVTPVDPDTEALALVRRWQDVLATDLEEVAGYRLEVTPTCARLLRRADLLDPTQGLATPRSRRPFDRRRYAYLALALAVLGRAGAQVTLTDLGGRLRSLAEEIPDLGFDPDVYAHRLALCDALEWLEQLGALRAADGSTASWQKDPEHGEALYDIDHDTCFLLVTPPRTLQQLRSAAGLVDGGGAASRDTRRRRDRQRICRLLLERPVVYFDDLGPSERGYARNEARELAERLGRLTGAQLERRAEGLALVDPGAGFSDRRFPATGSVAQAALLLAERIAVHLGGPDGHHSAPATQLGGADGHLGGRADGHADLVRWPSAAERHAALVESLDRARPAAPDDALAADPADAPDPADAAGAAGRAGRTLDGGVPEAGEARLPLVGEAWLAASMRALCERYGRAFGSEWRDDPVRLGRDALALLESFDLVRSVPGGIVALPALARYRRPEISGPPGATLGPAGPPGAALGPARPPVAAGQASLFPHPSLPADLQERT